MKRLITVAFLSLLLVRSGSGQDKAPVLSLKDLHGKTVKLSDFKGKVVLLNFWATWCVPCAAEVPQLVEWQTKYADRLQIVGITYPPTSLSKVRRFAQKNKINYPILLGSKSTKRTFDAGENLPFSVIIDREGKVTGQIEGIIYSDEFDAKIETLFQIPKP